MPTTVLPLPGSQGLSAPSHAAQRPSEAGRPEVSQLSLWLWLPGVKRTLGLVLRGWGAGTGVTTLASQVAGLDLTLDATQGTLSPPRNKPQHHWV